ncbi:MAG TPA: VIT domain-containing protein [Kofleriaceae bacterium]|nr:VIT domain-containing protein [Kofleriaceae bacterium]
MPRLLLALIWLAPLVAHAAGLPRLPGMYTTQAATPLPMLDSKIEVTVRGPIVETTVTQTFKNDSDNATEATYIFPLPADAAVSAMAIDLGTKKIHAAIEPRDKAQARYEEAVAHGLGAGMLEQERPDVFTQTVSAIPARGTVIVTLRYDATARFSDGTWELALPLVVAPRYVPGTASGRPTTGSGRNPDTDRSPDASRVTPHAAPNAGGATQIELAFQTAVEGVTSPTHTIDRASAHYTITDPKSDRDLIVRWRAKPPAEGWVEIETNGSGFAAALVVGPAATAHAAARCRFLLDRAATTRGDGDIVERAVLRALLGALDAKDRAGLVTGELVAPADLQHSLDESWASGNRVFDLTRELQHARLGGAPLVLITDGLISDDAAAIAAAKQLGVPVHAIGIGPAPNRSLLAALAAATGGTVRYALAGDDLQALARDVISDAASPPAALAVSWGTLSATDVVPAQLPRVGAGQATLVVARVAQPKAANARARGDVFALSTFTAGPAPAGATTPRGALARRWARLELDELLAKGNPRAITEHALAWGLVSPYTAMVAIGDEVVVTGGVKHTKGVPVSLPAGMQWQPVKHETTVALDGSTAKATEEADQPAKHDKAEKKPVAKAPGNKKSGHKHETQPAPEAPRTATKPDSDARRDDEADDKARSDHKQKTTATVDVGGDHDGVANDEAPKASPSERFGPQAGAVALSREPIMEDEAVEVTGTSTRSSLRFDFALGGGAAVVNGDGSFVQTTRIGIERGRRTLFGGEATLWLSRGIHAEGTVLGTISRRFAPHLELGGGLGLHVGSELGPALDLELRYQLPAPLWLYLRYDGALLFHDATRDGQNTATFGISAHF